MFDDIEFEEISIDELRQQLIDANDSYYNDSVSPMSDEEYDIRKDLLKKLSPNDSFFSRVGAPVGTSEWKKEKHKIPMGSLNKVNTEDEFETWIRQIKTSDRTIQTNDLVLSCKLDGISIDLEYENGVLIKAITRGDGIIGEDIFSNVIQMKNVKSTLKGFTGSLRGEIVIHKDDFVKLNIESVKNGDRKYKNPRNAASGVARKYDGPYVKFCTILYYDITGDFEYEGYKFHKIFSEYGLDTAWYVSPCTKDELKKNFEKWEEHKRENYPYEIDGLCIYVNNCKQSIDLGFAYDNPKGKIAWKFGSIKKETVLNDVTWEVGLNRHITPVGQFDPTPIGGITVENATIHNVDIFKKLNLGKGDRVIISRRNDVIPYLENVIEHRGEKFLIPAHCPSCGHDTEIEKVIVKIKGTKKTKEVDGKFLICPNDGCKALYLGNLQKWIMKNEIMNISYETIEKLYRAGKVIYPSDFYKLVVDDFISLDGLGEKSGNKIIDQLKAKMNIDLPTFIGGLNMSSFSNSICEKLVNAGHNTLDSLFSLTEEELCKIPGIKEKIANKIIKGIDKKKDVIKGLIDIGIKIIDQERIIINTVSEKMKGMSFVFTGPVQRQNKNGDRYTREDLQKIVVENYGENHTSVNKKTTYLVQADPNSQSSKTKKAIQLGVTILSEEKFFKMFE